MIEHLIRVALRNCKLIWTPAQQQWPEKLKTPIEIEQNLVRASLICGAITSFLLRSFVRPWMTSSDSLWLIHLCRFFTFLRLCCSASIAHCRCTSYLLATTGTVNVYLLVDRDHGGSLNRYWLDGGMVCSSSFTQYNNYLFIHQNVE